MSRALAVGLAALMVVGAGSVLAQEEEAPAIEMEEAPAPAMQEVESTAIKAIGYDEVAQVLTVEFTSGETYEYVDVPKDVYEAFLAAESKGEFFQANIKGKFEFTKK